jgi:hypothetical protein
MRDSKLGLQQKPIRIWILIISVAVVFKFSGGSKVAAEVAESVRVTANFGATQPLPPKGRIELHTSRPLLETEGRLAIVIGEMDVTSLCVVSGNDVIYTPKPFPLPLGQTSVIVYLVSAQNEWMEIARLPLLVEEPKVVPVTSRTSSESVSPPAGVAASTTVAPAPQTPKTPSPFQFIPSISVNVKSQSTALFFPDSSRPERLNFTDIAVQATLQGNYQNKEVSIQNQFDLAGSSVQNEALRFGQLGADAPQFDLSAYSMQYQLYRAKLRLGNVSFGSHRELINSFSSRGISLTVPITKRFDIGGAIMNGTSIVGYDNFFGMNRSRHRISSATLGVELLQKRPGGFRIELSALNGSLLPLNSFNQGLVSDAEKSKGASIRVVGSDTSQRLHFDGGFSRSRFTNPADPLLYQQRNVIPVKAVWRNARYLEVAYDLLRSYKLAKNKPLSLNLAYRHERVDPLYRSVAAFSQADHLNNQFDLAGTLGTINFASNYTRSNDNLNGIKSILQTLSRRSAFNIAAAATSLFGHESSSRWNPRLSYNFDRIHQYAAFVPINGDFVSSTQIPDQVSLGQGFAAEWQLSSKVRAGYRFNYSFQDNRQAGRERSDLLNENNAATVGLNLIKNLDLSFDLGAERASSFQQDTINNTFRVGTSVTWRMTSKMAWALNASTTGAGDRANTSHRRDADLDIQYTWRFLNTEKDRWRKMQGQFFVRYANRYGSSRDFLFGFNTLNKLQTFNAGLSFTFF